MGQTGNAPVTQGVEAPLADSVRLYATLAEDLAA
jgi:hypothetical protein